MLFLHGDRDQIIPAKAAEDTVKELRRIAPRVLVETHFFRGRGHDVTLSSDDGRAVKFFQQHKREPFPHSVTTLMRDLKFPRRYWIEILDKDGGVAEVEGNITSNNVVRLETRRVRRVRLLLRRELFTGDAPVRVLLNGKEVFAGRLPEDCRLLRRSLLETTDAFLAYSTELTFDVPR